MIKRELITFNNIIKKKFKNSFLTPYFYDVVRKLLKSLGLIYIAKWIKYKFNRYFLFIPSKNLLFFSQFIKRGDLVFDIGAWEGEYTEIFLRLGSKVIAVEPQDDCIKVLLIHYSKNKNVVIIRKAVGENFGTGILAICEDPAQSQKATLSSRFRTETRHKNLCTWTKFKSVSIITLDLLIESYGIPTFCKIDVEGFEESVLKGLHHPIPFISFEFHKELLDLVKKCCDHLSKIGNFKYNCTLGSFYNKFIFRRWVSAEELYSELKSRKDHMFGGGDIYAKYYYNEPTQN